MSTLEIIPVGTTPVHVPTEVPGFAFQCELPGDWLEYPVGADGTGFQDPAAFRPLAYFTSPDGIVRFAVAVRPAYLEGTLASWLEWLGTARQLTLGPIEPLSIGPLTGATCLATSETDLGTTCAQLALCEDGQSLFLLHAEAPLDMFDAMGPVLAQVVASFALVAGRGQTVPAV